MRMEIRGLELLELAINETLATGYNRASTYKAKDYT